MLKKPFNIIKINRDKITSFSNIRNSYLNDLKNTWIFFLDSDEDVSETFLDKIDQLINNPNYDGYWFKRRNYINNSTYLKHGYFFPDWQLRLIRNTGEYKYYGKVHEQINIPSEKTKLVRDENIYITHTAKNTKYGSFFHIVRFFPYIRIEAREKLEKKETFSNLLTQALILPIKYFYRCFIKLNGFKDGFNGFRAAVNWSVYQSLIGWVGIYYKMSK